MEDSGRSVAKGPATGAIGPAWRELWPVAPALLLVAGLGASQIDDTRETAFGTLLLIAVLPVAASIVVATLSVGGRRGRIVGGVLSAFALWCSWWFGWLLDGWLDPFTLRQAAAGIADAASYEFEVAFNLWPLIVVAAALTVVAARRRGRRPWTALGVLTLVLVALSFPANLQWSDGCNDHAGPGPLVVAPISGTLMEHGIIVIPRASSTQMGCWYPGPGVRPFWQP